MGGLIGIESSTWPAIPLCFVSPIVAILALYGFFGVWSYAVRKDIEADGAAQPG
jgi:hypothetical protein